MGRKDLHNPYHKIMATLTRLQEIIESYIGKKDGIIKQQAETIAFLSDENVQLKTALANALSNDKADADAIAQANTDKETAIADRDKLQQQLEAQSAELETEKKELEDLTNELGLNKDTSIEG